MTAYTGLNLRLGDYFVREVRRSGTERRQTVHFEIVGTGRTEQMSRYEFERRARPA